MKAIFTKYKSGDFMRIRDFLVSTYQKFGKGYNWTIERWNFSYSMARTMNGVSIKQWEDSIGIWENNGNIVGIVNSEGEGKGEAFFQVSAINISNDTLEEMFDFTEKKLGIEKEGKRFVQLRIPEGNKEREFIAASRGYVKQPWNETTSTLAIAGMRSVNLPKGFYFKSGYELSDTMKGTAHAKAFGYIDKDIYVKRAPLSYEALRKTPDYRADLDLGIVSYTGEIVSFCTLWYDSINKIGILEPVGTIPEYRRMGLGRAVIYEAFNRIAKEGAIRAYVGSSQDFYLALGFERDFISNIWSKNL